MGEFEDKTENLSDADTTWTTVRHMHMREAIDKLMHDFNTFLQEHVIEAPARTISPVLGAMKNCTLDCASPTILAQTIDTSMYEVLPGTNSKMLMKTCR